MDMPRGLLFEQTPRNRLLQRQFQPLAPPARRAGKMSRLHMEGETSGYAQIVGSRAPCAGPQRLDASAHVVGKCIFRTAAEGIAETAAHDAQTADAIDQ